MKIYSGLLDHMVLQRTKRGVCDVQFSGTCQNDGHIVLSVKKGRSVVPGFAGVVAGKARQGKFAGALRGLRTGGSYDITVSIQNSSGCVESLLVRDVLVGDVWILAGQSNMQGVGRNPGEAPDPNVRAFRMTDQWGVARDPIHNLWEAVDEVHGACHGGDGGPSTVGPGVPFGKEMHRLTGVPQGLICCAHGGTSMEQWSPMLKKLGGKSLYGATIRRFHKNGARVAGVAWYQGESDAGPGAVEKYTQRTKELVRAFRRDVKNSALPFIAVQISRVADAREGGSWNSIQDQQQRLQDAVRNLLVVPAIDLEMDDIVHIAADGQSILGRRIAQAMYTCLPAWQRGKTKPQKPPILPGKITVEKDPLTQMGLIVVTYRNVEGVLSATGRPDGFSVLDDKTATFAYRVTLHGNKAVIHTTLPPHGCGSKSVQYGRGCNPHCNIVDSAGRSLPVFGPVFLGRPSARTAFVKEVETSPILPSAGQLHALQYSDLRGVKFQRTAFPGDFCNRHDELLKRAPEDVLIVFRTRFRCAEAMPLHVSVGYDGPVKVWIDKKQVFFDPQGTNPALPDDARIRFSASSGIHEVVVALGSNRGNAWGIFLQYERRNVTKAQVLSGKYTMPEPRCVK